MARLSRIVAVNIHHHVTQRGKARRPILNSDNERLVYLDLLRAHIRLYELSLVGYCLMSNHVHLIIVPHRVDALALALKHTHGRYASFWNAANRSSGHVWQGRFYSCPLDSSHLWIALRYTELNPVRAGMVQAAENWPWSSAGVHSVAGRLTTTWRWKHGIVDGRPRAGSNICGQQRPSQRWMRFGNVRIQAGHWGRRSL